MVHLWGTSEGWEAWVTPVLGSALWPMLSLEDLQGDGGVLDGGNDTTVVQVQHMVFFLKDLQGDIYSQVRLRQGQ